jgi:hypothetical protein
MELWWCLTHARVEEGPGCPNMERMGPYSTREQAEGAIARAKARTEAEDAKDRAWEEGDS